MEDIDINIPETLKEENFTIIYKGPKQEGKQNDEGIEEIKTSKEELFTKLRYFKQRIPELTQTNELFVHDAYPINIFKEFILSLTTKKIRVNENNYLYYLELSSKYEYQELKQQLEIFSEKRPDLQNCIQKINSNDTFDSTKENLISKNLDICLQNEMMTNFPIPILIRILNSPQRKLNNHHLLYLFIKKVINQYENEKDENKEENIQLLLSSLNYLEMSNDELEELFNYKYFTNVFNNKGTREILSNFVEERKITNNKIKNLERIISEQKQNHQEEMNRSDVINLINKMNSKFEEQSQLLHKLQKDHELLQEEYKKQEAKLKMNEKQIHKLNVINIFECLSKNGNPYLTKLIDVETTSVNCGIIQNLFDKSQRTEFRLQSQEKPYILIDFKDKRINFSKYYFSVPIESNGNYSGRPKTWIIEGSNDKNTWQLIDKKVNDESLCEYGRKNTFNCQQVNDNYYRFIRIQGIISHTNNNYFMLSELEFYGHFENQ